MFKKIKTDEIKIPKTVYVIKIKKSRRERIRLECMHQYRRIQI